MFLQRVVWTAFLITHLHCGRFGFGDLAAPNAAAVCETEFDKNSHSALGAGTQDDPFLICTTEQFVDIGNHRSGWSAHYVLLADVNLAGYSALNYTPIGDAELPFSGTFDGTGNVVSNFSYQNEESDYVGLFGNVVGSVRWSP